METDRDWKILYIFPHALFSRMNFLTQLVSLKTSKQGCLSVSALEGCLHFLPCRVSFPCCGVECKGLLTGLLADGMSVSAAHWTSSLLSIEDDNSGLLSEQLVDRPLTFPTWGLWMWVQTWIPNLPSTCNQVQYSQKYILTICMKPKLISVFKTEYLIKCCLIWCHGKYNGSVTKIIQAQSFVMQCGTCPIICHLISRILWLAMKNV
jgi:hypothetical protein